MFQKTLIFVVIFLISSLLLSQSIYNGSINTLAGWDGTVVDGRDNGAFNGTSSYQLSINSPFDEDTGSGSGLFLAGAVNCSETQTLPDAAEGQEVTAYVDICIDANWTSLVISFYEGGGDKWDVYTDSYIDIVNTADPNYVPVTPDTDGTLDTFTTVQTRPFTLPAFSGGDHYRFFIGTSNSVSGYVGATAGVSQFAFDNVRINPPATKASSWEIYQ